MSILIILILAMLLETICDAIESVIVHHWKRTHYKRYAR